MQLDIFSQDEPKTGNHSNDTQREPVLTLADAYAREELIRTARRISRRMQGKTHNTLVVRVAIETDKVGKQLAEDEKQCLAEMVRGALEGDFPLPLVGVTYPRDRWEGLYLRIRDVPYCRDFEQRCITILHQVASEVGDDLLEYIIGNRLVYFAKMQIDSSIGRYAFGNGGDPERWPHTPATLHMFFQEAQTRISKQGEQLLALLSNTSIYHRETSPQSIVDRFADLDHNIAVRLLKRVHRINFGHHRDPTGRIPPEELWNGKTVADVIAADLKAERDQEERWETFQRHRRIKLLELNAVIKEVGSHPATITKALKARGSDIRLRTAQSQYSHDASIDLGPGGLFWSGHRRLDDTVEAAEREAEKLERNS